jgi:hypothetical protein
MVLCWYAEVEDEEGSCIDEGDCFLFLPGASASFSGIYDTMSLRNPTSRVDSDAGSIEKVGMRRQGLQNTAGRGGVSS